MNFVRRLEILEDAMLRQGGDGGYKLVVAEDGETPQEAIAKAGLIDWPADRVILVGFVKVDR